MRFPELEGRLPAAPLPVGWRGALLLGIGCLGLWSVWELGLSPAQLVPSEGGWRLAEELFLRALSPALTYEGREVPPGTAPLLVKALQAAGMTVVFAATALSLSLLGGMVLGFFASTSWWLGDRPPVETWWQRWRRRLVGPAVYGVTRLVIAVLRSIHELLWAVLFLAAFGLGALTATLAIALHFSGALAKVFSEIVDEAPRQAGESIRAAGGSSLQVFFFGLLPRALPDMSSYAFYRLECALRSSAIMGFFGFPTLGYYLAASFENLYYGEVWTYLYTLLALVIAADWWSGALRRRMME